MPDQRKENEPEWSPTEEAAGPRYREDWARRPRPSSSPSRRAEEPEKRRGKREETEAETARETNPEETATARLVV